MIKLKHIFLLLIAIFLLWYFTSCSIIDTFSIGGDEITKITNNNIHDAVDLWTTNNASAIEKYGEINTWDTSNVTDMRKLFINKTDFNDDISSWKVHNVTDMSQMFWQANNFNQPLNDWDTSKVKNMRAMFEFATNFDQPLNDWDVSKVTNMESFMNLAESFNQPLNDWDVSSVTDMSFMFSYTKKFNQPLNKWNVSKVTNMRSMFSSALNFNGDISGWKVGNVTDMNYMFADTKKFNQPLNKWNVSKVTDMSYMFTGADNFNGDISGWNVGKVTDMNGMFLYALNFNNGSPIGVSNVFQWSTSSVIGMSDMFLGAQNFNGDISDWDVSKVTNMSSMFREAKNFNQNLNRWKTDMVTDMNTMFLLATNFNNGSPIGVSNVFQWSTSNVTDMSKMFEYTPNFNGDISGWNVAKVTNMSSMFEYATNFNQDLNCWMVNLNIVNITDMFYGSKIGNAKKDPISTGCWELTTNGSSCADCYKYTCTVRPFRAWCPEGSPNSCIKYRSNISPFVCEPTGILKPNASNINCHYSKNDVCDFETCCKFTMTDDIIHDAVDLWTTNNASAIEKYGEINTWDTSKVTDMSKLFLNKKNFNDNISSWKVDNVKNMGSMFSDAKAFDQPLNDWNTIKVERMDGMFYEAKAFNHPLNNWKIGQYCKQMNSMFAGAEAFDQPLNDWDVSSVTNMGGMFNFAVAFNQDISGWDVSKVKDMRNMFLDASKFNQNLNCWKVDPSKVKIEKMFTGTVIGNSKNDPISTLCWQYTMKGGDCKECSSKYICDGNSGKCFNSPYGTFTSLSECNNGCLNKNQFNYKYCNNDTAYQSCQALGRNKKCSHISLKDRNNNSISGYNTNNYCINVSTGEDPNNRIYNCVPKCNPDINGCNRNKLHNIIDGNACDTAKKFGDCGYDQEYIDPNTLCKWDDNPMGPKCKSTNYTCG